MSRENFRGNFGYLVYTCLVTSLSLISFSFTLLRSCFLFFFVERSRLLRHQENVNLLGLDFFSLPYHL